MACQFLHFAWTGCFPVVEPFWSENEDTLQRVKDSKENLKCFSETRDRGEEQRELGETKEKQHSTDADHDAQDGFSVHWFFFSE